MNVGELKELLKNLPDHYKVLNENGGRELIKIEVASVDLPKKGEHKKLWLTFR